VGSRPNIAMPFGTEKTRMAWLLDGEKNLKIPYVYSFHATHERDRQTDGQTPHDDIGRAYASHRAAKTKPTEPHSFGALC